MNDIKRVPMTPARKKRRRRKKILRISLLTFLVLFFVTAFILAFRIPQIQITSLSVEGNSGISTEEIKAIANRDLEGNYLLLFPKKNIVLFPKQQIIKDIRASFNQVGVLTISRNSLSSVTIHMSERKPNSLWCADVQTCYFMDKTGFIFALAPSITGNAYLKHFGSLQGNPINKQFLSPDELSSIDSFAEDVRNLSLTPASITYLNNEEYQLLLENGETIYFTSGDALTGELTNLKLLLSQSQFKAANSARASFDYIDLRYGNKLIYKITGETHSLATTTASSS